MFCATRVAFSACCWVAEEIDSISEARLVDTEEISCSAWPAASDSLAPSTTPRVEFSMAETASCVSV